MRSKKRPAKNYTSPSSISTSDYVEAYKIQFEKNPKKVSLGSVAAALNTYPVAVHRRFGSVQALHKAAYPPEPIKFGSLGAGGLAGSDGSNEITEAQDGPDAWPARPSRRAPAATVLAYVEEVLFHKSVAYADSHVGDVDAARCVDILATAITKLRRVNGTSMERAEAVASAEQALKVTEYEIRLPALQPVAGKAPATVWRGPTAKA